MGIFSTIGFPSDSNELGQVPENLPSYEAGLRSGDKILTIDGKAINRWEDITDVVVQESQSTFDVVYSRNGVENSVTIEAYLGTMVTTELVLGRFIKRTSYRLLNMVLKTF